MKENKCKNCIYYIGNNTCVCDKFELGYADNFSLKENSDCVRIENDEGWGFEVGEDFGCIHFQNKK